MGVISIDLAILRKKAANFRQYGKSKRTAIAENHTHSFDRDRLTYFHYNSIRIRDFIAMGVISIDLAILRKKAGNIRQYGKSKRTAIAENHTHSFDRDRLTYFHYNSIRIRAFIAMGVISIDLAILRKKAGNFRQYGKSKRTAIAENHTHSFDRDRLTYSHYNSIRFRAFIAMGVISTDLAILRKKAGNFRQYGKSKRTAIAKNHTHSFDRDRLTYFHYNSIRIRAFIAMGVISIDLAILRKKAGNFRQYGKSKRTAIAENHTHSFGRASLTYCHYNSIRSRALKAMGVISIDLAILRKKAGNFRLYGKSKRTAIAENHTHSFDRDRLTYPHYNSIRIRAFIAMGVISIVLALLRKNARNFRQYGKSKRTAIAENHTHSFDRDRLTYFHYNSIQFRAVIAICVISIDLE